MAVNGWTDVPYDEYMSVTIAPNQRPRLLLVEDEVELAEMVRENLEAEDYQVEVAHTGEAALNALQETAFSLLVLDVMLPGMSGFEVLRALRQREDSTAVLILTARTEPKDRMEGFSFGADDYLGKPFSVFELIARIKAIIRRTQPESVPPRILNTGPFRLNFIQLTVYKGRTNLNLTFREFRILEALVTHPGKVHSRRELINLAWELGAQPTPRAVDVHIAALRKKLMATEQNPLIQTIEREGYRWLLPVSKPAR